MYYKVVGYNDREEIMTVMKNYNEYDFALEMANFYSFIYEHVGVIEHDTENGILVLTDKWTNGIYKKVI